MNRNFIYRIISLLEFLGEKSDHVTSFDNMKTSGYFSVLHLNNRYIFKREVASIFVLPNQILKKIYIYNIHKKLIPQTFLMKQFQKQVGLPKNFTNLNLALSRIMKWYSDRGYQWALVDIHNMMDPSSIIININEGLINTITTEYYTSSFEKLSDILFTQRIEQYLGVTVGLPLNINFVQRKINYLKNNKLIANITYSVERSKDDPSSLDIVFQVQELKDKELLIFGEETSTLYQIVKYFDQLIGPSNSCRQWLTAYAFNINLNTYYFNSGLNYIYNDQQDLIRLLIDFLFKRRDFIENQHNLLPLSSWTKKSTIGFRLYLRNIGRTNSFCAFNIKSIKNILNMKALYLDPSLLVNNNSSIQVTMHVFKQQHAVKDSKSSIFLRKQYFSQYLIESLFVYNCTSYFSVSEKILLSQTSLISYFFHSPEAIYVRDKAKDKISSNYDFLRHNTKVLYQNVLTLLLILHYQNFNSLDWPTKGYQTEFHSLYFIPFQKSDFLSYHCVYNYKSLFSHKIHFTQVSYIGLPFRFNNRMHHILVSRLKIQSHLGADALSLLNYNYTACNILYKFLIHFCIKFRLEYHVPISTSWRILVFYNYLDSFSLQLIQKVPFIPKFCLNQGRFKSTLAKKFFYGLGIQIRLPIKQIPPLSIEYTINSSRQFCLYLHISHQR